MRFQSSPSCHTTVSHKTAPNNNELAYKERMHGSTQAKVQDHAAASNLQQDRLWAKPAPDKLVQEFCLWGIHGNHFLQVSGVVEHLKLQQTEAASTS